MTNLVSLENRITQNHIIVQTNNIKDSIIDFSGLISGNFKAAEIYSTAIINYADLFSQGMLEVLAPDYQIPKQLQNQFYNDQNSNKIRNIKIYQHGKELIEQTQWHIGQIINKLPQDAQELGFSQIPTVNQIFQNAVNFHITQFLKYLNNEKSIIAFPAKNKLLFSSELDPLVKLCLKYSKNLKFSPAENYRQNELGFDEFESIVEPEIDEQILSQELQNLYNSNYTITQDQLQNN